jgi:hypothetical protein
MAKGLKTGGRKAGSPNNITKELRSKLNMFINENYDLFIEDYNQLAPKDRVNVFVKLFQISLPKPLDNELQEHDVTIIID